MTDPFIDALHDGLTRAGRTSSGAGGDDDPAQRAVTITQWWDEFVDVLGQKVGAWNERRAPHPPINFTKQASDLVHVGHRSAEATLSRDGDAVRVTTRVGTAPSQEAMLAIRILSDGNVVAVSDREELRTPAAAAEHVLTPVLVATFANP